MPECYLTVGPTERLCDHEPCFVFLDNHPFRSKAHGSLGEHDIAFECPDQFILVNGGNIKFDIDWFFAVCLLRLGMDCRHRVNGDQSQTHEMAQLFVAYAHRGVLSGC